MLQSTGKKIVSGLSDNIIIENFKKMYPKVKNLSLFRTALRLALCCRRITLTSLYALRVITYIIYVSVLESSLYRFQEL